MLWHAEYWPGFTVVHSVGRYAFNEDRQGHTKARTHAGPQSSVPILLHIPDASRRTQQRPWSTDIGVRPVCPHHWVQYSSSVRESESIHTIRPTGSSWRRTCRSRRRGRINPYRPTSSVFSESCVVQTASSPAVRKCRGPTQDQ